MKLDFLSLFRLHGKLKKHILLFSAIFLLLIAIFAFYYIVNTRLTSPVSIQINCNDKEQLKCMKVIGVTPMGKSFYLFKTDDNTWVYYYPRTYKKILLETSAPYVENLNIQINTWPGSNKLTIDTKLFSTSDSAAIDILKLSGIKQNKFYSLTFPFRLYSNWIIRVAVLFIITIIIILLIRQRKSIRNKFTNLFSILRSAFITTFQIINQFAEILIKRALILKVFFHQLTSTGARRPIDYIFAIVRSLPDKASILKKSLLKPIHGMRVLINKSLHSTPLILCLSVLILLVSFYFNVYRQTYIPDKAKIHIGDYQTIAVNYLNGRGFHRMGFIDDFGQYKIDTVLFSKEDSVRNSQIKLSGSTFYQYNRNFNDYCITLSKLFAGVFGWWNPGYPALVGFIYKLIGNRPDIIMKTGLIINLLLICLMPIMGFLFFKKKGIIAGFIAAFYTSSVYLSKTYYFNIEAIIPVYLFFLVVLLFLLEKRNSKFFFLFAGILFGLGFLIKITLAFIPGFYILFILIRDRKENVKVKFMKILWILTGYLIIVLPWTIYATHEINQDKARWMEAKKIFACSSITPLEKNRKLQELGLPFSRLMADSVVYNIENKAYNDSVIKNMLSFGFYNKKSFTTLEKLIIYDFHFSHYPKVFIYISAIPTNDILIFHNEYVIKYIKEKDEFARKWLHSAEWYGDQKSFYNNDGLTDKSPVLKIINFYLKHPSYFPLLFWKITASILNGFKILQVFIIANLLIFIISAFFKVKLRNWLLYPLIGVILLSLTYIVYEVEISEVVLGILLTLNIILLVGRMIIDKTWRGLKPDNIVLPAVMLNFIAIGYFFPLINYVRPVELILNLLIIFFIIKGFSSAFGPYTATGQPLNKLCLPLIRVRAFLRKADVTDVLLLALIALGVMWIARAILFIFSDSLDIGGSEVNFVKILMIYLKTGVLYPSYTHPPFDVNFYFPVYFILMKICALISGVREISPAHFDYIYITGRVISFVNLTAALWMIYLALVKLMNVKKIHAFAVSLVILILMPTLYIAVRPDSIRFFLYFAGLYFALKFLKSGMIKEIIFTALFSGAAIAVKQDTIMLALSVAFILIFTKNFKSLLLFLGISIGVFALLTMPFMQISFRDNFIQISGTEGFSFAYFRYLTLPYILKTLPFIFLCCLIILKFSRRLTLLHSFLALNIVLNFLLGIIFSLKIGGGYHYLKFFETTGLMLIAIIISHNYFSEKESVKKIVAFTGIVYVAFLSLYMNTLGLSVLTKNYDKKYFADTRENCKSVVRIMNEELKMKENDQILIYTEELFIYFPLHYVIDINRAYKIRILFTKAPIRIDNKLFNRTNPYLEKKIAGGKIKYLITYNDEVCKKFVRDDYPGYRAVRVDKRFIIYRFEI